MMVHRSTDENSDLPANKCYWFHSATKLQHTWACFTVLYIKLVWKSTKYTKTEFNQQLIMHSGN